MKRLMLLSMALVAMCAMGLLATSAFAVLPDVSITLGAAYPLNLNFSSTTTKTRLETVAGVVLSGEGLNTSYGLGALSALGTFRATFLKVVKGTEKCLNTGIEANGEVLTEGSFHIVYTSLAGSGFGLRLGVLYLPTELTAANSNEIDCPASGLKIRVKGSVIGTLNLEGTTETTQLTSLKGVLNGSLGKQEFRAFYNLAGIGQFAQLLSSLSNAPFKESNQVASGEPQATSESGKMFTIAPR